MRIKMFFGIIGLCLIVMNSSAVMAIPVTESYFDSNAQEFIFTGYSPYSISTITTDDFTVTGGRLNSDGWNFYSQLNIDFSMEVSAVGIYINRGKASSLLMEVYDSEGALLEDYNFSGLSYPSFIGLGGLSNEIALVTFQTSDDIFVDHLAYQNITSAAPVPEPASMLLLGSGLVLLAGFRRKLKKS